MRPIFIFLLLFILSLRTEGQNNSILQKMQQDSAIDIFLTLDWRELEKKRMESAYLPAHLEVHKTDADTLSVAVKVKTRGHMRLSICSYPPIKLKFDKSDLSMISCSPLNELDLVHHCHNGEAYDQYILKEYLAYKLYQLLSPYSFNVQLVRIHYRNRDNTEAHEPSIGFFVENEEELVDRLGGKRNKMAIMNNNAVEKESFLRVCLFQFMIGNTDWYIPTRHNLDFIAIPGHSLLVTVPFDFDYSGLVAAPYAAPHESIKLSTVVTRYYQGWCEPAENVVNELNQFSDKKEEILSMCEKIQGMSEKSKKYVRSYLQEFFDIIENPKKAENQIVRHCDMWPVPN